jgi:hypothetical protein
MQLRESAARQFSFAARSRAALREEVIMPHSQLENLPLAGLKPWNRNARVHSPKQLKQIAASINRFGFTNPVLLDEENSAHDV